MIGRPSRPSHEFSAMRKCRLSTLHPSAWRSSQKLHNFSHSIRSNTTSGAWGTIISHCSFMTSSLAESLDPLHAGPCGRCRRPQPRLSDPVLGIESHPERGPAHCGRLQRRGDRRNGGGYGAGGLTREHALGNSDAPRSSCCISWGQRSRRRWGGRNDDWPVLLRSETISLSDVCALQRGRHTA